MLTLMNLSYSEQGDIAAAIEQGGTLNQLSEWLETYPLRDGIKGAIAGIYYNVIDYLCDSLLSTHNTLSPR